MGMSTNVIGIRPPDAKWLAMKAIYDACEAAGVPTPEEVDKFFDYTRPDPKGVHVELEKICVREYRTEDDAGYEIDVAKIPADVKTIRFWNSW